MSHCQISYFQNFIYDRHHDFVCIFPPVYANFVAICFGYSTLNVVLSSSTVAGLLTLKWTSSEKMMFLWKSLLASIISSVQSTKLRCFKWSVGFSSCAKLIRMQSQIQPQNLPCYQKRDQLYRTTLNRLMRIGLNAEKSAQKKQYDDPVLYEEPEPENVNLCNVLGQFPGVVKTLLKTLTCFDLTPDRHKLSRSRSFR